MTWSRTRLKYLVDIQAGAWGDEPGRAEVDVHCVRAADFDRVRLRVLADRLPIRSLDRRAAKQLELLDGDLILEKSGGGADQPVGGVVMYDLALPAVPSNFAARLRPSPQTDPRYLSYLLAALYRRGVTDALGKQTTGIANLDVPAFMSTVVTVPDLVVQRMIADYLDAETGRLESLTEAYRRLRELASARTASRLTAIFDGKPQRLKHLASKIGSGKTPAGGAESYVASGVALIRSMNVRNGWMDLDDVARIDADSDASMAATRLSAGDVLVNITGASIGRSAVVFDDVLPANVNQHVCIIRPRRGVDPDVLCAALMTPDVQAQIAACQVGGNRDGLTFEQVGGLEIRWPTGDTAELARGLRLLLKVDRALARAVEDEIDLLLERRQALIAAAVSGQLEIPGAAA